MNKSPFHKQAALMLRCLPAIAEEKVFALKGGTAINMFVRPMPRLSIDIDLTYLPIEERQLSLTKMSRALDNIAATIERTISGAKIQKIKRADQIVKLVVTSAEAKIKIEPNEVIRGTTSAPILMDLVPEAEALFELSVTFPIVPLSDLYGGKICAALDRQHPRDLFDIMILLENEGLTEKIRKGFIVALASHERPMHELITPTLQDVADIYEKEFKEMLLNTPPLKKLYEARTALIVAIKSGLTKDEKKFLLSLKQGQPDWPLLGLPAAEKLPGIQWKLLNILKMSPVKREEQFTILKERLEG